MSSIKVVADETKGLFIIVVPNKTVGTQAVFLGDFYGQESYLFDAERYMTASAAFATIRELKAHVARLPSHNFIWDEHDVAKAYVVKLPGEFELTKIDKSSEDYKKTIAQSILSKLNADEIEAITSFDQFVEEYL